MKQVMHQGTARRVAAVAGTLLLALQGWTPDRVGRIERAILRIALYEMRYKPDVPPKVAINEALEVAKKFSTQESSRFINGILDRIHKELRPSG